MKFLEQKCISNAFAQEMIKAAERKAKELGIAVNIAVVDTGGHLIAFSRMDHAHILSIGISQNKAYSAIAFRTPTHKWYDMIKDNPSLKNGIVHTDKLIIFGGGYPIFQDDLLVGGIGVSGGSEEEDQQCAEAALSVLDQSKSMVE